MQHELHIISDELFEESRNYATLSLNSEEKQYEIIISPHISEHFVGLELLRLKIHTEENNTKLNIFGHINQLPSLGTFSDKLILDQGERHLKSTHEHPTHLIIENKKLPEDIRYLEVNGPGPKKQPRQPFIASLQYYIPDEEVIKRFSTWRIFIRKSTYDLFWQLRKQDKLPKNSIWCEINPKAKKLIDWINQNTKKIPNYSIIGHDRKLQKSLMAELKDHYQGIQLLCSAYNNCFFWAVGGVSVLFSLLPIKCMIYMGSYWEYEDNKSLLNNILKERYGKNDILCEYSSVDDQYLHLKIANKIDALKEMTEEMEFDIEFEEIKTLSKKIFI